MDSLAGIISDIDITGRIPPSANSGAATPGYNQQRRNAHRFLGFRHSQLQQFGTYQWEQFIGPNRANVQVGKLSGYRQLSRWHKQQGSWEASPHQLWSHFHSTLARLVWAPRVLAVVQAGRTGGSSSSDRPSLAKQYLTVVHDQLWTKWVCTQLALSRLGPVCDTAGLGPGNSVRVSARHQQDLKFHNIFGTHIQSTTRHAIWRKAYISQCTVAFKHHIALC